MEWNGNLWPGLFTCIHGLGDWGEIINGLRAAEGTIILHVDVQFHF